jgi:nicotinate-nucleotide adenylyltransferase
MNEQRLLEALRERLSPERFEHSLNTAESAAALAKKYGADGEKAHYAGLAHDICKQSGTKLSHASDGAEYLMQNGLCSDEEILGAVRYHTTGHSGMTLLEKIVFIADLISAERDYPDVETVRGFAFENLDEAVRYVLLYNIKKLTDKGEKVHPDSTECLKSLS